MTAVEVAMLGGSQQQPPDLVGSDHPDPLARYRMVRQSPAVDEMTRIKAVELVRHLLVDDFGSEAEAHEALRELQRMLPDPRVADLIFWPDQHRLSDEVDTAELSAERIFDLALRYEPFTG